MHLPTWLYSNRFKWIMVYHTAPDSEEVEMFNGEKFFDSEKEAWDWFHANYRIHHYVQPEAVKINIATGNLSRQE